MSNGKRWAEVSKQQSLILPINRFVPSKQGKSKISATLKNAFRGPGQISSSEGACSQGKGLLCAWKSAKEGFGA